MADSALTLEQAADIPLADDTSTGIVPVNGPVGSQDALGDYSEYLTPENSQSAPAGLPESRNGLTLDEAAQIELADDHVVADTGNRPEQPIAVVDGVELTLSELINAAAAGTRLHVAAERVAEQTISVEEGAQRVAESAWKFAGILSRHLPPLPDERMAAYDPTQFVQRQAIHDDAERRILEVVAVGDEAKHAAEAIAQQQHLATLHHELHQLVQAFPACETEAGREEFLDGVREAVYACGFSESDMRAAVDHRLFRLAHLAAAGLEALQEKEAAPKPAKRRRSRSRNRSAMERLKQTGSFEDAVLVDFD